MMEAGFVGRRVRHVDGRLGTVRSTHAPNRLAVAWDAGRASRVAVWHITLCPVCLAPPDPDPSVPGGFRCAPCHAVYLVRATKRHPGLWFEDCRATAALEVAHG